MMNKQSHLDTAIIVLGLAIVVIAMILVSIQSYDSDSIDVSHKINRLTEDFGTTDPEERLNLVRQNTLNDDTSKLSMAWLFLISEYQSRGDTKAQKKVFIEAAESLKGYELYMFLESMRGQVSGFGNGIGVKEAKEGEYVPLIVLSQPQTDRLIACYQRLEGMHMFDAYKRLPSFSSLISLFKYIFYNYRVSRSVTHGMSCSLGY